MALYSFCALKATPSFAADIENKGANVIWKNNQNKQSRERPYKIPTLEQFPEISEHLQLTRSKAKITRIIDEQTIVLDNDLVVQLADLYFEYNKNGRGPDALSAYDVLQEEFLGTFVNLYQPRPAQGAQQNQPTLKNGFGHDLGHVVRIKDDAWIQGSLISSGITRVYSQLHHPSITAKMLETEQKARQNAVGFWNHNEWALRAADLPKSIESDRFQIIEGTVLSVSTRQNQIYLNFGIDWKEDMTIRIASDQRKLFSRLNLSPMNWAHQKLRVRGWVEDFNGPMITILHPSQIELISDTVPTDYKFPDDF